MNATDQTPPAGTTPSTIAEEMLMNLVRQVGATAHVHGGGYVNVTTNEVLKWIDRSSISGQAALVDVVFVSGPDSAVRQVWVGVPPTIPIELPGGMYHAICLVDQIRPRVVGVVA